MPSTLVISDLHIGSRRRTSVLEHAAPLERLLAALDGIERLVLLGDVAELLEGAPAHALEVARPILRSIGARLGRDREVVLVPGNHDRPLIRRWVRSRHGDLEREAEVPPDASPALARITEALAPARVQVRYPGFWLADGVWATHGHYLDRHLFPVSAYGRVRGSRHRLPDRQVSPWSYERSGRPHLSPLVRWLPRPLAAAVQDLGDLVRASTMPRIGQALRPEMAPVTARLLGAQMRRHSLPALARVAHELGIRAEWVVFGHVHRVGPLPQDDPAQWQGPGGGPRLANTGSWLYEPRLVNGARPPHPYWPGGAVRLGAGTPVQALGLLDDLDVGALRGR